MILSVKHIDTLYLLMLICLNSLASLFMNVTVPVKSKIIV